MADKRKLQAEIDRCLKKVTEGVETFDDIWEKVHSAANANQKEKYEADLKKEIKKLQRLRDQIKTWIQSSEIKDKLPLKEHRKLIETQMEKFKVVERETKTKAYSKEGLGAAAKVDPVQKEREDVRQWLTECINKLSQEVEQFDAEIESLYAGSKKRKLDRDKADRVEELQEWVEKHKYHIRHLEAILRKLDNCTMEPDEIKEIQEDVNYYIDYSQEPDFTENELIYEDLNIDDSTPAQGLAQLTQNDDEVFSGTSGSPPTSTVGPLSPPTGNKTITPLKSTSQELFEERRRGKTLSQSESTIISEVPPSPRRPPTKSQSVSSNNTMVMPVTTATTVLLSSTSTIITTNSNTTSSRTVSSKQSTSSTTPSKGFSSSVMSPSATATTPLTLSNSRISSLPSTNGSTGRAVIAQLPKPVQPPSGPAYSVAAGGHHNNNSTQSSMSPPSQQSHDGSSGSGNSMVNHIGALMSPSSESTTPSSSQVMTMGSPLQNGPVSLMSPLSKQQQMSGLLSMTSSLSIQKPPVNIYTNTEQTQHLPNTTSSLSQSSTNSSYLDEAIFSAPSSSGNSLPQSSHLTVDTQFQQEQQQQQQSSTPSSAASGNSLSSATSNSTSGGNNNSSPVSTPMPSSSAAAMGLTSNLLMNDTTSLVQPISMSLRPSSTASSTISSMMGTHSFNMILNANTFHAQNALTATGMLQASMGVGGPSKLLSEQLGSVGVNSSDLLSDPSGTVLSPSNSASSLTSTGLSSTLSGEAKEATTQLSSLKAIAEQAIVQANLFPSAKKLSEDNEALRSLVNMDSMMAVRRPLDGTIPTRTDAHLQPLLGVSPLGPVMLSKENIAQAHMLETVFRHLPQPADSEKVRPYLQRNPHPSPLYHHQHPPSNFDTFDLYQRLSIETLFFIFYYMEGTKAQYLAAKALKKQSWRFHTKYMMWFQRHEEPKAITDEYEMGTYIYFDFEKWQQRKKEGFTFEYKFLEDKELP